MASFDNSHTAVRYLRGLSPHSQPKEPPRTYDEYVGAYGINCFDAFIKKYQDRSERDPSVASFEDLTSNDVVLVLTRAFEQPGRLVEHHLVAPHVPHLVAYLFLQAYLPNSTLPDKYSPALVFAKEYSNSFGLFSPISSPMWTTCEEWHGDKRVLLYPRKDIYKLLLQTVQEDICNLALAAKLGAWLNDIMKVFPEDESLAHPTIHSSHEYLLRQHEVGHLQRTRQDVDIEGTNRYQSPEDLPKWSFDDIAQSASARGAPQGPSPVEQRNDATQGASTSSGVTRMFLRSDGELYTCRLRTRKYYNPTGHTHPLV